MGGLRGAAEAFPGQGDASPIHLQGCDQGRSWRRSQSGGRVASAARAARAEVGGGARAMGRGLSEGQQW